MKKRLLVLTSTFPRWKHDATPAFVARFCEEVADNFEAVYVLAPHAKGAKPKERDGNIHVRRYKYFYPASQENIAYEGGAVGKISKNPLYVFKLACLLLSLFFSTLITVVAKRVSVVNAHWIIPQGFVAILVKYLTGAKVIVTVHGSDIFALKGKMMSRIKRFVLKHADAVIVNSSATLHACKEVYANGNYHVIPVGVDTERFQPRPKQRELVKEYQLNDFTILYVGRLSDEKGVIYLLRALKKLQDKGIVFKALIVGDGWMRKELEKYAEDSNLVDNVIFTGWVKAEDMASYFNTADVFVGPSLREAQGLVFAEALFTGLPVIATTVGGIPDIVIDGKTGYLVSPKSDEEIYAGLLKLHDNLALREKIGENGKLHVRDKFSWQSVRKRFMELVGML